MGDVVSEDRFAELSLSHLPWALDVSRGTTAAHSAVQLGDARVVDCRMGGMTGSRSVREVRRTDGEYVAVLLVRGGSETFSQDGRQVEVGPGAATIWDGVRPCECASEAGLKKSTLFLPRDVCRTAIPGFHTLMARAIPDSPAMRLLFGWLGATTATADLDRDTAAKAGGIAVDLLAWAVGASPELALDATSVRLMEIKHFIDTRFADATLTVADIAYRCGFDSPSSFSRSYRAAYGRSPREARSADQ